MLKKLIVKDWMTNNVKTSSPDEDVVFAFEKLMKNKISSLPIVDENNNILGIVTASNLGHNLILDNYHLGTKVDSVMVKDIKSISPNDSLQEAVSVMTESNDAYEIYNQLPVLENGKLVGIISDGDIIRSLKK
ncbi:CBS domain-containing protein [Methanobrevibacter curvatus]|uniref:Hypoxic response protein 1 n=1 Tax=Methanobrevibacter curvatus TaxID=49547 RepID=A0A165Z973_9EURY|nr:CBS domain-containing protein [Methanobrevibacter curvatus]KZX10418.1 hypoxic response protein 1 [Methanobrevibacter curvatus]